MIQEFDLRILPEQAAREQSILRVLVRDKGVDPAEFRGLRIVKRSIDARQRTVYMNVRVRVYLNEDPEETLFPEIHYPDVSGSSKTARSRWIVCRTKAYRIGHQTDCGRTRQERSRP